MSSCGEEDFKVESNPTVNLSHSKGYFLYATDNNSPTAVSGDVFKPGPSLESRSDENVCQAQYGDNWSVANHLSAGFWAAVTVFYSSSSFVFTQLRLSGKYFKRSWNHFCFKSMSESPSDNDPYYYPTLCRKQCSRGNLSGSMCLYRIDCFSLKYYYAKDTFCCLTI